MIWKFLKNRRIRLQLSSLPGQDALIVDVRSPGEFRMGANPKSINIPLDQFQAKLATLSSDKTIILCCASGARSGTAASILKKVGFKNVINAGSWQNTLG
ncbi:MAG: hypothetical protein A2070_03705 [Bdellovibrionales bacterium GWC1_52_8]|nr:MAG: hypothetical protein A2Z97_08295 [Bdellovibrionales bacterium GWB1_52_6]OFZ03018.1 MAG: hypothetical protein A2X97_12140 [Bdellovibrionales bacterium GWA1_52_35]OFZ41031.1 MAG: hypothetical protein A2070_03705 [Bdellovibrionales bacterium GWC1_52_8]